MVFMAGPVRIIKKDGVYNPNLSKEKVEKIEKSLLDAQKEIMERKKSGIIHKEIELHSPPKGKYYNSR